MMTLHELEQAIRDMLLAIYKKLYTGRLSVQETFYKFPGSEPEHVGYLLKLGLNKDEKPLAIAYECATPEEFLKYIEKELKERSLTRTKYMTAIEIYPNKDGEYDEDNEEKI